MNSKPRKKAKNGFSFFLDEYVEGQKKNGRILSHKIGAEECSVLWKARKYECSYVIKYHIKGLV